MVNRKLKKFVFPRDENPRIDPKILEKVYSHGFDPELGWARKPNTSKTEKGKKNITEYNINEKRARLNPGHEDLDKTISAYGDSFVFSRQVNDNETWPWYLSELTKTDIMNFGVGNYGIDQALLRLKKEYPKNKTRAVILGVVPMTIGRICNMWVGYREYDLIYGFKPRFILEDGSLKLIKNFVDEKEKFSQLNKILPELKKHDYFYENVFKKEMLRFPLLWHLFRICYKDIPLVIFMILELFLKGLKIPCRHVSSRVGELYLQTKFRRYYPFFHKKEFTDLFLAIIKDFVAYSKEQGFTPLFIFFPRLHDILYIKKTGDYYYRELFQKIEAILPSLDLTEDFLKQENFKELFTSDRYGGHYSREGNKLAASSIYDFLTKEKIIPPSSSPRQSPHQPNL